MSKNPVNPCKVITGKDTRLSYEHIWEPTSINGGNLKYSVCALIPKTDTVTVEKIRKAIDTAYREGESLLKGAGKSVPPMTAMARTLRSAGLAVRADVLTVDEMVEEVCRLQQKG